MPIPKLPRLNLLFNAFRGIKKPVVILSEIVLILILSFSIYSYLSPKTTSAAWFDDSWGYRKAIPINNTGSAQSNVYVTLSSFDASDTSKFQVDCDDIRFTKQNGELLPFYRPNRDCDASVDFHILFDSLPAGSSTLYLYYGNPSESSGEALSGFSTAAASTTLGTLASEEKTVGPMAYWKFDEGLGTTSQDATTNRNAGSLSNMPTTGSATGGWQSEEQCISGRCLLFDGSNDYFQVSDSSSLDNTTFTLSSWIKITGGSNQRTIMAKRNNATSADQNYLFYINASSQPELQIGNGATHQQASGNTTLSNNKWYHLSVTVDGSNIKFYINGALDKIVTQTITPATNNGALNIGTLNTSLWFFYGYIDEVKIYSYAKSDSQIQAEYNSRSVQKGAGAILGTANTNQNLSNGLVGYWKMDESSWSTGTGAVFDSSGHGYAGNAKNSVTTTGSVAKFGNAGYFDGTDDYIAYTYSSPAYEPTTALTVSLWFKAGAQSLHTRLISTNSTQNVGYDMVLETVTGYLEFNVAPGNNRTALYASPLNDNVWHHAVGVWDGKTSSLYIDGRLIASSPTTQSTLPYSQNLLIGANNSDSPGTYFNGYLDEVRIYNRGLSPVEVTQLYNYAPGPIAYWSFEEGEGSSSIKDFSGNNIDVPWFGSNKHYVAQGKFGKAGNFTTLTDYGWLAAANSTALNAESFTLSFWMKTSTYSDDATPIGKHSYGVGCCDHPWEIYLNNATHTRVRMMGTVTGNELGVRVDDGQWHYIAVTRTPNSNIILYQDGKEIGRLSDPSGTRNPNHPLSIGVRGDTPNAGYTGLLDEIKFYNYARSPKQILEDMNGGHGSIGTPVSSTVGHYKFDEGYGTVANDISTQGNNLTLSSASWTGTGKFNKAWNGLGNIWISRADDNDFDFADTDDASISLWFKSDSTSNPGSSEYLIAKGTTTGTGYAIYANSSGNIVFGIDDDSSWSPDDTTTSTTDLYDNTWHHLVATKTGTGRIDLYIDGRLNISDTSISAVSSLANSLSLYLGDRDGVDNGDEFNGDLDEVKIYRAALTVEDVKQEYNRGSSLHFGSLSDNSNLEKNSGNAEYCIPGDTSNCNAPLLRLDFEEKTGHTAYDKSGNGINANLGTTTSADAADPSWKAGRFGSGMKFDDSDDLLDLDTPSALNFNQQDFTLETWFKHSSGAGGPLIGKQHEGNSFRHYVISVSSSIAMEVRDNGAAGGNVVCDNVSTSTNLDNNSWRHVAFVLDDTGAGTTCYLYIDGKLESTDSSSFRIASDNSQLFIGSIENPSSSYGGTLDDVRIYGYARTAAQVAWDYNKGAPIAQYKLDECQGTVAYDSSINGNNGTITIGATGTNTAAGTCTNPIGGTGAWYNGSGGKNNFSLSFDGTNDYIDLGDKSIFSFTDGSGNDQPFSLSAWIKLTDFASPHAILSKYNNGSAVEWYFSYSGSQLSLFNYISAETAYIGRTAPFTSANYSNQWTHVVATYDGSEVSTGIKLYVNGKRVDNATAEDLSPAYTGMSNTASTVQIGSRFASGSVNLPFQGLIDEAKIYNYSLTPTQVKDLYTGGSVRFGPSSGNP